MPGRRRHEPPVAAPRHSRVGLEGQVELSAIRVVERPDSTPTGVEEEIALRAIADDRSPFTPGEPVDLSARGHVPDDDQAVRRRRPPGDGCPRPSSSSVIAAGWGKSATARPVRQSRISTR